MNLVPPMQKPYASSMSYHLKDGTEVTFRQIVPEDKGRMQAGFEMLSDESKYLRFFMPNKSLTEQDLSYLTEVDQVQHVAWGALSNAFPDLPGLGTCRFIRVRPDDKEAEFAITILDDFQGQGLGTHFLALVYLLGYYHGLDTLVATVLQSNHRLIDRLKRLGGVVSVSEGITSVNWPITNHLEQLPENEFTGRFKSLILTFNEKLKLA